MSARNDGGAAFPMHPNAHPEGYAAGMSLRDWFAGQASDAPDWFFYPGYPSHPRVNSVYAAGTASYEDGAVEAHQVAVVLWHTAREAAWRFALADALLAERRK